MGQSMPYAQAVLSDDQVEQLRRRMVEAADRMTGDQLLVIADTLHDVIRRKRWPRAHRVDVHA